MNILYKYCDQLGIVKILESLELKLPFISEVNDPFECLPIFYCPNDKASIEARYLSVCKRRNIPPSSDYKQKLNEQFEKGEIQKYLVESQEKFQEEWNQRKGCLLSVSKTAKEPVMWAHYSDKHKGAVIGIDFDNFLSEKIKMDPVVYSKYRHKVNILGEPEGEGSREAVLKTLITKSDSWKYEEEFRTIFLVDSLEKLQRHGLACFKDFRGKQTWFLRLSSSSVKEVVFGLHTYEKLKLDVKKLISQPELQHIRLYQVEMSETYTFNLNEIGNL